MEAILALEDGRIFRGRAAGARKERSGEVVFNTAITGYQEIFTDPSYTGQIVVLTHPHIGNVGANRFDVESSRPYIEALVVREFSGLASNWRSQELAEEFLSKHNIPVIHEIDTRALVRHLRTHGAMRAVLSTASGDPDALIAQARSIPQMVGLDLAKTVTTAKPYQWRKGSYDLARGTDEPLARRRLHVVAFDYGIKQNILRLLVDHGCRVTVVPAFTSAEDTLALEPDGVFLSNGPGDPEPVNYGVELIRKLAGRLPIFGICLGHQIMGLALGGKTYKLKFGHHGANHPVKNLLTGKVEITSQNHGFAVDPDSLPANNVEITHMNLNDSTVEGLRHRSLPMFSVQYHPEASPGPHDSRYLFGQFIDMMREFPRDEIPKSGREGSK